MKRRQEDVCKEALDRGAASMQGMTVLRRAMEALDGEAFETFRAYVAILREWDQKERSSKTSGG